MTAQEFIENIKSSDLSKVSYDKIRSIIRNNSLRLPYTTAIVKKGAIIERGRINEKDIFYNSEFEISYRTDIGNIKEFGRANHPFQSRFYGAMSSNEIKMPRIVLFSELVEQFIKKPILDFEITMTVGRWEVKEDFEVADACFSNHYFKNKDLKKKHDDWVDKMKGSEIGLEEFQNLLSFFSDEFANTEIKNHHDYKLSCIYSDFAIYANNLNGICYPSVKTEYDANNIALTSEAVERFLELKKVAMFKYEIKNGKPILIPTYFYSDDLGSFNSKFNCKQQKPVWGEILESANEINI